MSDTVSIAVLLYLGACSLNQRYSQLNCLLGSAGLYGEDRCRNLCDLHCIQFNRRWRIVSAILELD